MVERVIIVDVQTINLLTLCVPIKNFLQLDISFFSWWYDYEHGTNTRDFFNFISTDESRHKEKTPKLLYICFLLCFFSVYGVGKNHVHSRFTIYSSDYGWSKHHLLVIVCLCDDHYGNNAIQSMRCHIIIYDFSKWT